MSKICYFDLIVVHKYIIRFDVPMNDDFLLIVKVSEGLNDLLEIKENFFLREGFVLEELHKILLVAVLHDDVEVVFWFLGIDQVDYVGVVEFSS